MSNSPVSQQNNSAAGFAPVEPRGPSSRSEAFLLLQDAVQLHLRDGASLEGLRSSLNALSRIARSEEMPPERMLVELKQALHNVPTLASFEPEKRGQITDLVVRLAIELYYGTQ
jgi:hypothetical protein